MSGKMISRGRKKESEAKGTPGRFFIEFLSCLGAGCLFFLLLVCTEGQQRVVVDDLEIESSEAKQLPPIPVRLVFDGDIFYKEGSSKETPAGDGNFICLQDYEDSAPLEFTDSSTWIRDGDYRVEVERGEADPEDFEFSFQKKQGEEKIRVSLAYIGDPSAFSRQIRVTLQLLESTVMTVDKRGMDFQIAENRKEYTVELKDHPPPVLRLFFEGDRFIHGAGNSHFIRIIPDLRLPALAFKEDSWIRDEDYSVEVNGAGEDPAEFQFEFQRESEKKIKVNLAYTGANLAKREIEISLTVHSNAIESPDGGKYQFESEENHHVYRVFIGPITQNVDSEGEIFTITRKSGKFVVDPPSIAIRLLGTGPFAFKSSLVEGVDYTVGGAMRQFRPVFSYEGPAELSLTLEPDPTRTHRGMPEETSFTLTFRNSAFIDRLGLPHNKEITFRFGMMGEMIDIENTDMTGSSTDYGSGKKAKILYDDATTNNGDGLPFVIEASSSLFSDFPFEYSLEDDGEGAFEINSTTGRITVGNKNVLMGSRGSKTFVVIADNGITWNRKEFQLDVVSHLVKGLPDLYYPKEQYRLAFQEEFNGDGVGSLIENWNLFIGSGNSQNIDVSDGYLKLRITKETKNGRTTYQGSPTLNSKWAFRYGYVQTSISMVRDAEGEIQRDFLGPKGVGFNIILFEDVKDPFAYKGYKFSIKEKDVEDETFLTGAEIDFFECTAHNFRGYFVNHWGVRADKHHRIYYSPKYRQKADVIHSMEWMPQGYKLFINNITNVYSPEYNNGGWFSPSPGDWRAFSWDLADYNRKHHNHRGYISPGVSHTSHNITIYLYISRSRVWALNIKDIHSDFVFPLTGRNNYFRVYKPVNNYGDLPIGWRQREDVLP